MKINYLDQNFADYQIEQTRLEILGADFNSSTVNSQRIGLPPSHSD